MAASSGEKSQLSKDLQRRPVLRDAMMATTGVIIVVAIAMVLWFARVPVLLAFAGVLLAIVLHGGSEWINQKTGIPRMIALGGLIVLAIGGIAAVIASAGPTIVNQTGQLVTSIGTGITNLSQELFDLEEGETLFQNFKIQDIVNDLQPWGLASGATAVAGNVLSVVAGGFIVLFFGIYVAADPGTHVKLISQVAAPRDRKSTVALLRETGDVLRRWIIGQAIAMAAIGALTYVGLLILGVPMAFALALFAALAGFLPYLGPIIGAVPILLVAGGDSLQLVLYVLILYLIVQGLESYLLTPLIQARAVRLPPAVVILNQLVMGALFGILGIALATPLAAAATIPLRHWFGAPDEDESSG
ncbi:AI-2E family transporter [Methyloligella solikamskensis]|uniref:AI-2E family transporter n=1 Tax=Methyloligella solikamskensis TaxID=1177756 RepID=A0ABW3J5S1_9HYPH